jgi:hypothetical protein
MAFNINQVLQNFQFEGARPTLFDVRITNPINSIADSKVQFLCSATSLPESTLGNVPVPYFGRVINFAGDRTYSPWTVTVMNDEDFLVRNALEEWSNAINQRQQNTRLPSASNQLYKSTATVRQFNKAGTAVRSYKFNGIYPSTIQPIGLDWSDTNQFERFQVTFTYDWWQISTSGDDTNNASASAGGA